MSLMFDADFPLLKIKILEIDNCFVKTQNLSISLKKPVLTKAFYDKHKSWLYKTKV